MNKTFLTFVGCMGAGVCLLLAANVQTDYDHAADFSQFQSYSWIKAQATDSL